MIIMTPRNAVLAEKINAARTVYPVCHGPGDLLDAIVPVLRCPTLTFRQTLRPQRQCAHGYTERRP